MAMMQTKTRRWTLIIATTVAVLLIAGFVAFQFAVRSLKGHIEKALGPQGEVKEIHVNLTGIEIIGMRIRAPRNPDTPWPAEDELRAERIRIVPAILDLLSAHVVVRSIRIEGAYISMLRAKDGRMRVLPAVFPHSRNIATDIAGIKIRVIERRIEQAHQAVVAAHQSVVHGLHGQT